MKPGTGPGREVGEGYKYVAVGLQFAAGIILFTGLGLLLDRWLGLTPLFTLAGTVGGSILSFLNVYWRLRADEDRRRGTPEDSQ